MPINFVRRTGVRVTVGLAVVATLVGGLSACSSRVGAAAVINGQSISVSQLNHLVDEFNKTSLGSSTKITDTQLLDEIIIGEVANKTLASFVSNPPTDEQLCAVIKKGAASTASPAPSPSPEDAQSGSCDPWLISAFRAIDLSQVINSARDNGELSDTVYQQLNDALLKDVRQADIQVNGRYGVFDPNGQSLLPTYGFPWAKAAATPAPTIAAGE